MPKISDIIAERIRELDARESALNARASQLDAQPNKLELFYKYARNNVIMSWKMLQNVMEEYVENNQVIIKAKEMKNEDDEIIIPKKVLIIQLRYALHLIIADENKYNTLIAKVNNYFMQNNYTKPNNFNDMKLILKNGLNINEDEYGEKYIYDIEDETVIYFIGIYNNLK